MNDNEFGIPEQKKFPLDTEAHVRSAIRFFNYADPQYEKELASKIISKIHQYGITNLTASKENRFYKYYHPDNVEHHGIIGMHWHERNGPPYPLNSTDHNAVVKSAGKGGSAGSGGSTSTKKKKQGFFQKRKQKKNLAKAREAAAKKRLDNKEKDRVADHGTASEVYARRDELSAEQKQRAINRLNLDQQLANLSANERARKKSKVDRLLNTADKVSRGLSTAYNIANTAKNLKKLADGDEKDSKDKEKRKKIDKAIRSGDAKELRKYSNDLSSKDIDEFFNVASGRKDVNDLASGKSLDSVLEGRKKGGKGKGISEDRVREIIEEYEKNK